MPTLLLRYCHHSRTPQDRIQGCFWCRRRPLANSRACGHVSKISLIRRDSLARPELGKQGLSGHGSRKSHLEVLPHPRPAHPIGVTRIASMAGSAAASFLHGCRATAGYLKGLNNTSSNEKADRAAPAEDFNRSPPIAPKSGDHRKRLRNMPFTLKTFRFVAKRMSIHSWIGRVISRADVPTFERTVTEMPLYLSTGKRTEGQRAISKLIHIF